METKLLDVRELKELLAVPGSGTREQIVYLDVDDLVPDPRNFYELSDIDALAENVSLFGIQQPLRVRADPMDPDKYVIVSGHRRREAVRKLVEEDGREDLRQVPCIVEAEAGSEALQELRLIYANSDTRRMTSAEISRQAVRVEALLYELKEQGYDFPGRMRDHVAEACKVSKSKLSRLKVIRDKLIPVLAIAWETGELNEEQAYNLSQLEPKTQQTIYDNVDLPMEQWYGWRIRNWSDLISSIRAMQCPVTEGGPCAFTDEKIASALDELVFKCVQCCKDCARLTNCDDYCRLCDKDRKEKLDKAKAREEEARARAAEDVARFKEMNAAANAEEVADLKKYWQRVGEIWRQSGVSAREAVQVLTMVEDLDEDDVNEFVSLASGDLDGITPASPGPILPYALCISDLEDLCGIADFFGVSLDYLLGRTEVEDQPKVWQTGSPPRDGRYYARFEDEAGSMTFPADYRADAGDWSVAGGGMKITAELTGWWWLPED